MTYRSSSINYNTSTWIIQYCNKTMTNYNKNAMNIWNSHNNKPRLYNRYKNSSLLCTINQKWGLSVLYVNSRLLNWCAARIVRILTVIATYVRYVVNNRHIIVIFCYNYCVTNDKTRQRNVQFFGCRRSHADTLLIIGVAAQTRYFDVRLFWRDRQTTCIKWVYIWIGDIDLLLI